MVVSELLVRPVYNALWRLYERQNKLIPLAFYAPELIDYLGFEPVAQYLPPVSCLSSHPQVLNRLRTMDLKRERPFSFVRAIVMSRHSLHRFPHPEIVSIGMRHGPYHFKRMTRAANYNRFDLYLFSSQADLAAAEEIGVRVGKAVGFPRLDPAFNGKIGDHDLMKLSRQLQLDPNKPVLLFTATWDASGMSAIEKWVNKLPDLSHRWNILVTLHPWTSKKYWRILQKMAGVRLLETSQLLKAMMLSDICIGDQSSILAECCALDKPIVSFRTPAAERALSEIESLLEEISIRIDRVEELEPACKRLLANPALHAQARESANQRMFDTLDGKAGKRAADAIIKLLTEKGLPC